MNTKRRNNTLSFACCLVFQKPSLDRDLWDSGRNSIDSHHDSRRYQSKVEFTNLPEYVDHISIILMGHSGFQFRAVQNLRGIKGIGFRSPVGFI